MTDSDAILTELKECFTKCQDGQHTHTQLVKRLNKLHQKAAADDFLTKYVHCMNYFLVEYRREPAVERGIDFITKFAVSLVAPRAAGEDTEQEPLPEFVMLLFQYLLKHQGASSRGVRFRCCQLVHKLLHNLGEHAQIDDDLYDQIFTAMMTRLRDKFPVVRVQAIQALTRLQDPGDPDCPVVKALMFLMTCDPHPDVRKAALANIALSKKTLKEVLSRTRDVKENIRVAAYKIIAEKVHIKALSIAQRVKLLQDGLSDRAEPVRDACGKGLLQTWLGQYGGNILEVLERLDVEESHETVAKALEQLYKHCDSTRLVKDLDIINENCVIPVEKLSCENTFYWRSLCQHLREQGDVSEELLETVLPTPVQFCQYITSVVTSRARMSSIDDQLRNEFMLDQLVQLVGCLDLADTTGRNAVEDLLRQLLLDDDVSDRLVAPLVKRLRAIHVIDEKSYAASEPSHVTKLVEIIADIRVPVNALATQPDTSDRDEERRKLELKMAGIRVKLNQIREDLSESVYRQEFQRAAELKAEIAMLEAERDSLMTDSEEQTSVIEETRIERNDPAVLLKCLKIASEMLYHLKMTGINPVIRTLMETLIIPGIMTEEAPVRREAIRALGLCALQDKQTAREHFVLFLQICQVDIENIRLMAMTVVFDIVMTHGLEAFETEAGGANKDGNTRTDDGNTRADDGNTRAVAETDEAESETSVPLFGDEEDEEAEADEGHTVKSIISVFTSWIDNESTEIRTCAARGLAKLLAIGRVSSPRLLSRLMILWYNPLTEDDTMLRHFLGTFFPVFAFDSTANQEAVEDSFILTLRTLLDAPVSSPLSTVNVKNVVDLLIQLCDWRHLAANRSRSTENLLEHNIHNSLAMKLCNEILSDHDHESMPVLCWSLNQLSLQPGQLATLQDLHTMVKRICGLLENRSALRSMERFLKTVRSHISEQPPATPLSQPRHGTKSRVRTNQSGDESQSQPSDPEPSIDDYTPPEGASQTTQGSRLPSQADSLDNNRLPSNNDDNGCRGDGGKSSQSEVSAVSESSQSEMTDQSEASTSTTRRSRRTKTAQSTSVQSSGGSANVRRSARKKVLSSKTDSESENSSSVFLSPEPQTSRNTRAARVTSERQKSRDSEEASDDGETMDVQKGKRRAPTVLSDIENDFV